MAGIRESYHNETIIQIKGNLIQISYLVKHIKLIYCPTHKSIKENENTDDLAKTVSKKASHLPPRTDISLSEVKEIKRQNTLEKQIRRLENTNFHKYKQSVPALCKKQSQTGFCNLKKNTRKGAFLSFQCNCRRVIGRV